MYVVVHALNQHDPSSAESRKVGDASTLAEARAIVRHALGLWALRASRRWHNPADHVTEAWCGDEDGEGFFILEGDE